MERIRAELARNIWLSTLQKFHLDPRAPANDRFWSPKLDTAPRDELMAIQTEKLRAVVPFLYENSDFYRRRFHRLGMIPSDIQSLDDLSKWPPIDKAEMVEDAPANAPYGTYTTMTEDVWAQRGWMMFSSSGSTGAPRVFRYSHIDRQYWAWSNARACHAMGFRKGDTVFMMTGYGPHVFAWGVQYAMEVMGLPTIPGGGLDARARVGIIDRFKPTILVCTPSYALHLARVMQGMGLDPAASSIRLLLVGGEPALSVTPTWRRIEALWGARVVEFYGCTEASPHVGGYSCTMDRQDGETVGTHLMEDVQIWETVDPDTREAQPYGEPGLTVCTNLASESSPQLRFLVGDYTVLDPTPCPCGRSHVRAMGSFAGRADDLINLRGIKMFPVQIEDAVRAIAGSGDEFEIVLERDAAGLDTMTVRCEHAEHAESTIGQQVADEIRSRCEVRVTVEVLPPGTLPKTEFKAKRVQDRRGSRG